MAKEVIWEYYVVPLSAELFEQQKEISDCGKVGWELVTVICTSPDWAVNAYFKRLVK